jgi:hypothetical protein
MYIHICIHTQDEADNTVMWVNSLMTVVITGPHFTANDAILSGCNSAVMPVDGMYVYMPYVCVCVCFFVCVFVYHILLQMTRFCRDAIRP